MSSLTAEQLWQVAKDRLFIRGFIDTVSMQNEANLDIITGLKVYESEHTYYRIRVKDFFPINGPTTQFQLECLGSDPAEVKPKFDVIIMEWKAIYLPGWENWLTARDLVYYSRSRQELSPADEISAADLQILIHLTRLHSLLEYKETKKLCSGKKFLSVIVQEEITRRLAALMLSMIEPYRKTGSLVY